MQLVHGFNLDNLRGDIFGGLTAAVVALPLALAFGVVSGLGPLAGLYGAIVVGFFAALLGGTPSQVSGPTGPMTVVMATVVAGHASDLSIAFTIVLMGGLFQIAFGALRMGRYINLVPITVTSGFMSGIGCIIILLQLNPFVGHGNPAGGIQGAVAELPEALSAPNLEALALGALSLSLCFFTPKRLGRLVPPPLIALTLGTLLGVFVFPAVPIIGEVPSGLPAIQWPHMTMVELPSMLRAGFVLGLLGSLDSLLTSLIADQVTRSHHEPNRELFGQGVGNVLAGLLGGIPGAGATMRTVVNVRAGGRTPISGMVHSLVLLAVVLGAGPLASHIPHAVLAGILINVGLNIIDWRYLRRLHTSPKAGVGIMVTVLLLTIFVDLIVAVGVGVVLASLLLAKRMADHALEGMVVTTELDERLHLSPAEARLLKGMEGQLLIAHLKGVLSFGAATSVTRRLSHAGEFEGLLLDVEDVLGVDTSAGFALETLVEQAAEAGTRVYISGMSPELERQLLRLRVLDHIPEAQRLSHRHQALSSASDSLFPPPSVA